MEYVGITFLAKHQEVNPDPGAVETSGKFVDRLGDDIKNALRKSQAT